jgi:transposase
MAHHYGAVVIPARPGRPQDKSKAEVGVQVAQRWILARLRNQTFFSLAELNDRIRELLTELNDRTMRVYGKSRRELYEMLDRPALMPLPSSRFAYGEWKIDVGVNIDYHVQYDGHYYSVPHQLVGERVDVRATAMTIEIFAKGTRVASHTRSRHKGRFSTRDEHMPKSHRAHAQWSPERIIRWAGTVGPGTQRLVKAILEDRPHPEQGYRSCLGILRLADKYGHERLEQAAARAFFARARSYTHVESILKHGLDRAPLPNPDEQQNQLPLSHTNLRGADYYSQKEEDPCSSNKPWTSSERCD